MAAQADHISSLLASLARRGGRADAPSPDTAPNKGVELAMRSSISLLDLPFDVLAIILEQVPPYEIPRLRRVSKAFNQFLTSGHVLSPLLRYHFPYHVRDSIHVTAPAVHEDAPADSADSDAAESAAAAAAAAAAEFDNQIIAGAPLAFDSALKRFFNRAKGKPTSITVITGVRVDACYETETSYDHMFLVFHHISGRVFIYDSGNRFPNHSFVTLDVRSLGVPWYGYRIPRRNVRQSVVLDKRILIVSGTREFDNDPERRIPQAVYSLHNYPTVELIGIWRGVPYHEHLNSLCANDEWIGCRVNRHYIKLIKVSSLRHKATDDDTDDTDDTTSSNSSSHSSNGSSSESSSTGKHPQGPSPHPYEITFPHPTKGYIKDVHLAKEHVFVYSVILDDEGENGHGQIDVFSINLIPSEHRDKQLYEIAHVRSVLLHSWQGMFMEYVGYPNPEEVPEAMRCQRWDKIYPFMRGNKYDGMPEEDNESVMMTLGKTFRANGNVPIGCARIYAKPEMQTMGPPVLETVPPGNIIPFCIALESSIQEEDANYTLLLPRAREDMRSRAELMEGTDGMGMFEPNPWDPDVPASPDDVEMTTGDSQDSQPGDDAAYILHFGNGTITPSEARKVEPTLPRPSIREAWYLDQDQTQRSSVITEEGLFHIFYDEPGAEEGALNLMSQAIAAGGTDGNQILKEPVRLFPSHMQHVPLEDIFDPNIQLLEISLDNAAAAESRGEVIENYDVKKQRLDKLMRSIRGGWSCYVWSAETWNGFLITTVTDATMVILRYD
ncbi:hypothetical protein H072_1290 [Dactylellina haptotyla CBS 200.50]|uniref:F-box domain-containing protein n=1 Tax=Dactylellina haptotyla (strain CBS 200.50) TaxID=1284197 RepID=S8AP84_DACHA|nr:hypothetical protein H072_1290 [Dactylellina haptotyla CBS 200.50]